MIAQADALHIPLADESVHMICTSPPYWGLRDYQLEPQIWEHPDTLAYRLGTGDDSVLCKHEWGDEQFAKNQGDTKSGFNAHYFGRDIAPGKQAETSKHKPSDDTSQGQFCSLCGAWRGNLGLEPTPELYVEHIVQAFREVWRVLRPDGGVWLNLGDSYSATRWSDKPSTTGISRTCSDVVIERQTGLPPKNLVGIPWRVAFALQADGWWLRSDIIWNKPNPMPESVTDRPTRSHEYVFLLAKAARYFMDMDAIREPQVDVSKCRSMPVQATEAEGNVSGVSRRTNYEKYGRYAEVPGGRNKRTVWTVNTQPFKGAHFATFPEALVEPMVLAGSSPTCCSECGAPWERVTEKDRTFESGSGRSGNLPTGKHGPDLQGGGETLDIRRGPCVKVETKGWHPTCQCNAETTEAVVLDLFCGSGTVGRVCRRHSRKFVGLDLSFEYLRDLALARSEGLTPRKAIEELPLFEGIDK